MRERILFFVEAKTVYQTRRTPTSFLRGVWSGKIMVRLWSGYMWINR